MRGGRNMWETKGGVEAWSRWGDVFREMKQGLRNSRSIGPRQLVMDRDGELEVFEGAM